MLGMLDERLSSEGYDLEEDHRAIRELLVEEMRRRGWEEVSGDRVRGAPGIRRHHTAQVWRWDGDDAIVRVMVLL